MLKEYFSTQAAFQHEIRNNLKKNQRDSIMALNSVRGLNV